MSPCGDRVSVRASLLHCQTARPRQATTPRHAKACARGYSGDSPRTKLCSRTSRRTVVLLQLAARLRMQNSRPFTFYSRNLCNARGCCASRTNYSVLISSSFLGLTDRTPLDAHHAKAVRACPAFGSEVTRGKVRVGDDEGIRGRETRWGCERQEAQARQTYQHSMKATTTHVTIPRASQ